MKEPLVYIILVNYNGYEDTLECIKSLHENSYKNYKIVLIDNDSNDAEKIKKDNFIQTHTHVIYADENNGFSVGNNIGISYALECGAEYVLLLNNDTIVDKNFLVQLIAVALSDDEIGIVTGDIFFYKETDRLWYSCGNYNVFNNKTSMVCRYNTSPQDVNFFCGCLALLSVEMIKKIGVLSDIFFLYSEDTEYSCRAIENGWRIVWTKDAKIYHKISASTGNNSCFRSYYLIRNNLYMIKLYGSNKLVSYFYRILWEIKEITRGRSHIKALYWAVLDFINGFVGKSERF